MLKVLVAPLDWGLGHATRCIPIIKELLTAGHTVLIAASGTQKAILQEEFPALSFVEIPGYHIKYTKNRAFTIAKIIWNIPKILIRIKAENRWLRVFLRQNPLDLIISDNRYGLHAKGVRSIFVTHQLAIRTGLGRLADSFLQRMNYAFIGHHEACWVPDVAGPDNLAGKLSHPRRMPDVPVRYIGWLSRFDPPASELPPPGSRPQPPHRSSPPPPGSPPQSPGSPSPEIDLLVLLSGPEPQRSVLEQMVLTQLPAAGLKKLAMVRGLPGGRPKPLAAVPANMEVYDHLPTDRLAEWIRKSRIVLSRPGYSTVMDLASLGSRAVFVPTPGQTEQEYLGRYLAGRGWAVLMTQQGFSLGAALKKANKQWPATHSGDIASPRREPEETRPRGKTESPWPNAGADLLTQAIRDLTAQSAAPDFG